MSSNKAANKKSAAAAAAVADDDAAAAAAATTTSMTSTSATAPADDFDETRRMEYVQLDAMVLLQIVNHTNANLPDIVTGQLLGLPMGERLEVTASFAFSNAADDDGVDYQLEMMHCLRDVNIDNNTVGWYQSTYLGSFLDESLAAAQFNYQQKLGAACVVLVYDALKTTQNGSVALHAYRLSDAFVELFATKSFTKAALNAAGLTYRDVFVELPVRLHTSALASVLLHQIIESGSLAPEKDMLDLATNNVLQKNLEYLTDSMDDLAVEQKKFQMYSFQVAKQQQAQAAWLVRRRAENVERRQMGEPELPEENTETYKTIHEPSRLDSLLLTSQIDLYLAQLKQFTGAATTKTYLAEILYESNLRSKEDESPAAE